MSELCLTVMYFRNGQILFLNSAESAKITASRCHRQLSKLAYWAIVDSSNATYSTGGETESAWEPTPLEDLSFVDSDENG